MPIVSLTISLSYIYLLIIDAQSTALVEKLLNDLLQTTEGYQKVKAEIDMVRHDEKLNQ